MAEKRRRRPGGNDTRSEIDALIDLAIAGEDDELARRARLVRDGKIDASKMSADAVWSFSAPDDLFTQFDWGRMSPGHVRFDAEYREWAFAERGQLMDRSSALINAMLLPLGRTMIDLFRNSY